MSRIPILLAGGAVSVAAVWLVVFHQFQADPSDSSPGAPPPRASKEREEPKTKPPQISPEQAALDSRSVEDLLEMFDSASTPLERDRFMQTIRALAAIAGRDPATALKLIGNNVNSPVVMVALQSEPLITDRLLKDRDTLIQWLATERTTLCGGAEIMLLQLRRRLIIEPGQFHLIDRLGMTDAQRSETIQHALASVAGRDLREALALMEQYTSTADHRATSIRLFAAFAGNDPERSFERLSDLGKYLSDKAYPVVFREWLDRDPQLAIEHMRSLPHGALAATLDDYGVLGKLVEHDPAAAASLLLGLTLTQHNVGIFDLALDRIAKRDPSAAMDLLEKLPAGEYRKQAAGRWLAAVTATNPAATAENIALLPAELQPDARLSAVSKLACPERSVALALAAAAPTGQQTALYREIVIQTSEQDAKTAIELLNDPSVGGKLAPDDRLKVIGKAAANLTETNPDAACDWISGLPPGERSEATGSVLTVWMGSDPEQAMNWLAGREPGPARNAGVRVVIDQLKNTNPKEAARWSAMLEDAPES